nr:MAG TPA: Interleukin-13 [Caudoviricetes sp.]
MKNYYIAVTVEQDRNENVFTGRTDEEYAPGYYAYVIRIGENENLKNSLDCIGGLKSANLCPTKKAAAELVRFWNRCYIENGTALYSGTSF